VLFLAQKMNLRVKEVAVNWSHVDGSKVNLWRDSLRMFWNIIEIRFIFRYNRNTNPIGEPINMLKNDEHLVAISSMSIGQKALIVAFSFDTEKGERIQKMGLVPGELLEIMRAPCPEGPIEIKIRGYFISLRKEEADRIMVKLMLAP
jgi:ferrous iron transport protein A